MSTKITDLRGSKVTAIHRGSVLLSKQEDLCSTSYVEPAVNRQPGFRRKLVEQIILLCNFISNFPYSGGPQMLISSTSENS